jgi:hypothetical protein
MLEFLDAQGREPFAGANFLCKPDQPGDLRIIDPRQVYRGNQQVDGAPADRLCRRGNPVDIVLVSSGK